MLRRRAMVWADEHGRLHGLVVDAALADFIHFIHCSGVPLRSSSACRWSPPLRVRELFLRHRAMVWADEHGRLHGLVVDAALADFIHLSTALGFP